jgi:hypothetical protein
MELEFTSSTATEQERATLRRMTRMAISPMAVSAKQIMQSAGKQRGRSATVPWWLMAAAFVVHATEGGTSETHYLLNGSDACGAVRMGAGKQSVDYHGRGCAFGHMLAHPA